MAEQVQGVPTPPPQPPAPAQPGQQAQQQQQQQDYLAPPAHAPAVQQPGQQEMLLNWSHFKPEFSGKPDRQGCRSTSVLHQCLDECTSFC